jgi:hypothetical protein
VHYIRMIINVIVSYNCPKICWIVTRSFANLRFRNILRKLDQIHQWTDIILICLEKALPVNLLPGFICRDMNFWNIYRKLFFRIHLFSLFQFILMFRKQSIFVFAQSSSNLTISLQCGVCKQFDRTIWTIRHYENNFYTQRYTVRIVSLTLWSSVIV